MPRRLVRWVSAVALLGLAVALRVVLDPVMGDALPLVTLFGAVAGAVWLGGYLPGIVVGAAGYIACNYLFIPPRNAFAFPNTGAVVGLLAYLFTCAIIIGFGEVARTGRTRVNQERELLRVTLRSIGDAVIATDLEGRITYLNRVAEALTGWARQDALGQPLEEVFHIVSQATRERVESPARRALREGVVVGLANHTLLVRRDGVECAIDDSAAPIKDDRGEVSGCVLIFRDVTVQRRLEHEQAGQLLTARLLASIVESSDDAIIAKSLDGVIQSWNAAAERLFGHPAEEAIGRHISLVIPPERIAEEDQIIASLRAGRRIEHFETERVRRDGQRLLVSLSISPIKDAAGHVVGASKIVRDVTRQRMAEAERAKFVTLVETSTDFIGICDMDGIPSFVNRAGLQLVGLDSIEEARRTRISEFFFPEDRARIMSEFVPAVIENGHGEIEVRFRHFKTGEARWMAYKVLTLSDATGRPVALATVSQDVSERKRLEDSLRKLAGDLSEADRRKDEFLATLAHELRNPLAPMLNMAEVMKRAGGDAETMERARATIGRQLAQLVRLVDDLLDINRITHNRLELRRSRVELASIIQHAVEASSPIADAAGHELRVSLTAEPVHLHADAARLAQVFGNLLHNSCKYTRPGGTIWIGAERRGNEAIVSVRDNGIGIPADRLGSIFEMFTQGDRSLEQSQGGLGIGLTLVKRLVEMHGGSIHVRSGGDGEGSEFTVTLPVEVPAASEATSAPSTGRERGPGRRILVVDDNKDSAESLAMLLKIMGNETQMAHDGLAAYEAVAAHPPEVVLLDIGLPTLTGHEVCRRIREQAWGANIVLIALTGWGQEGDHRKSRDAGFDGHLVKPVKYEDLVALLGTLLPARDARGTT